MKRLIVCALVLGVILGIDVTAFAATNQGDTEVTFFGSLSCQKYEDDEEGGDEDATMVMAGGAYGYFFTDAIEVAGVGLGMWTDDVDLYSIGVSLKYHFLTASNMVPYVGAQVTGSFFDADDDDGSGMLYGPIAGVKYFVSETTTIFAEYQFQLYGGELGDYLESGHVIVFGISFLFQ